jgi:hypothetical protein
LRQTPENPVPTVSDRRRQPRLETSIPAELRLVTKTLETQAANVSADGVYFVANAPLTVEVVLTVAGIRRVAQGRLVRLESRNADHDELGIAVRLSGPILDQEGLPLASGDDSEKGRGKKPQ